MILHLCRTANGGHLASITEMKNKAAQVQSAYNANYYNWKTKDCAVGAAAGKSTLGVLHNEIESNKVSIYPNPTTGVVTVSLPNNESFEVYNAVGKQLINVKTSETQIDLSQYASGIYFIKCTKGTFRIIKE
jgi:Secretion system C-terminal sorting domain